MSIPASAEVFIYNLKQSGAEYEYDGSEWTQSKVSITGYVIIEPNIDDANFVNGRSVETWKEKDPNGKMQKYYEVQDMFTFEFLQAQIGKKLMWIIMPSADDTDHTLLTGEAKTRKIGTENRTIAAKLTGYAIWDETDGDYRNVGSGTVLLQLNSKMTTDWHALSGEDATDAIVDYLESKGYIESSDATLAEQPESYSIEFLTVSKYGTSGGVTGRVRCPSQAHYQDYRVAVYIYVPDYGWVNKPLWDAPLTRIGRNGKWSCKIVTAPTDIFAIKVAAFLLPLDATPPILAGAECLPSSLFEYPHTIAMRHRIVKFAGYKWWVKQWKGRFDPGFNLWGATSKNVNVSKRGLILRNRPSQGSWLCSEVIAVGSLGYGTYVVVVEGSKITLDFSNAVLGLFLYEDPIDWCGSGEIDIELSTWWDEPPGAPDSAPLNAQYVIQPWDRPGNRFRFSVDLTRTTTYVLTWKPDEVMFTSYYGEFTPTPRPEDIIKDWRYTGPDVPLAGNEHFRMNFWLLPPEGSPPGTPGESPSSGKTQEVTIKDFKFFPI